MSSEAPPTALVANKYEIIRLVGRGGMGAVWEGRHNTLGTRVAVKFIDSEFADRPDVQKRFETEAKSAATIQSKHAIQIYDHGIGDDGRPYIVMEYLEGEPLDARLNRVHTMDLPTTARILQQVARALAKAHERGIIHRDLKPENIFLVQTLEDDEEIAKVLDFGIAKIIGDQAGPLTGATKTGAILGTPFYMSPEQARGLKEVDQRADVWSLGVIGFRSVVGKLPFDGQSVGDLLVNICTSDPPIPSHERPGLPAAFDAWIKRSLARSLDERFPNVAEQMEALAFAAGVTIKRPISSGGRVPNSGNGNGSGSGAQYRHTLPLDSASGSHRPGPASDGTPLPVGHVTSTSLSTSTSGLPGQATRTRWTLIGMAMILATLGAGALVVLVLWSRGGDEERLAREAALAATSTVSTSAGTAPPALSSSAAALTLPSLEAPGLAPGLAANQPGQDAAPIALKTTKPSGVKEPAKPAAKSEPKRQPSKADPPKTTPPKSDPGKPVHNNPLGF